jgi:hypothetical protein
MPTAVDERSGRPSSRRPPAHDVDDVDEVYDKIARRILPFLVALFVWAWLDRVNVGFAKLRMLHDLGFSAA